ncbi:hypothetical protein [Sphingomonas phage Carli]|nr:hypothetical protein [Sphingomonas phage Carli]
MDTIYNANGCFYRALDDEPVFVLLARDPCTPEAIRWWVTLRQALIGRGEKPLEDHGMLADALATATDAHIWRTEATDPTKWRPERWHVEPAPERVLVDRAEYESLKAQAMGRANRAEASADGSTLGGIMLPYDEWLVVKGKAMPLGNRFLIGNIGAELVFWENKNYDKPGHPEDWTGYYPVRHSLQKEMLWCAYDDWRNATSHTVDTIKGLLDITALVDLPPEEGRPDAILRKRLEPYDDDARVTISAGAPRQFPVHHRRR